MKKIIILISILTMLITHINATYFKCNDYKRDLYVEVYQDSKANKMTLYNAKGKVFDRLKIGKTKKGGTRYYGNKTTIYVYKNRRQFSIRSYNPNRNSVGNMFGVFKCKVQ